MSKFLRQMSALSKRPEDFEQKSISPNAPVSATGSRPDHESVSPIGSIPHIVSRSPVDALGRPQARRPKPRPARLAQDGHSHAEQAVYAALWDAGAQQPDGNRTVIMGLGRLSKAARLSENNCRLNIRTLVKKLAIEEIAAEDSRARIGKTYRVYSYGAILARRRAGGMEWVIRTKGVVFVDREGHELKSVPHTVSASHTDLISGVETVPANESDTAPTAESGGDPPTDPVSPFRNFSSNNISKTSSSASTLLVERLAVVGISLDDDAAHRIISRCQNTDRTATADEIAMFAETKVRQLAKRRNIENWPGMLMAAVPAYFDPPATELGRYRAGKRQEREEHERTAHQILEDPQSADQERQWATELLSRE